MNRTGFNRRSVIGLGVDDAEGVAAALEDEVTLAVLGRGDADGGLRAGAGRVGPS